jgi:hypothetical protein
MDRSKLLGHIIVAMREYQKQNNIEKQCITNVQFVFDMIKKIKLIGDVKAQAAIIVSLGETRMIAGHLTIILEDGSIVEPSYDMFSLKDAMYFSNIKDFLLQVTNKEDKDAKLKMKEILNMHLIFVEIAEQMNNGKFVIGDDESFYIKQMDHIEKLFSMFF